MKLISHSCTYHDKYTPGLINGAEFLGMNGNDAYLRDNYGALMILRNCKKAAPANSKKSLFSLRFSPNQLKN